MKDLRVLIACGGTGGHIFPAVALAEKLKEQRPEASILFAGVLSEHMQEMLKSSGYEVNPFTAKGMPRKFNILLFPFIVNTSLAVYKAFRILKKWRPYVIISMGSFSGGPFVLAARLTGLPVLIHEQNLLPGRANRISAYFTDKIATSFDDTSNFFSKTARPKIVFTGNPVRKEIFNSDRKQALDSFGLEEGKFTILVMGGSQGSHAINKIFVEVAQDLDKKNFQILHISGKQDFDFVNNFYKSIGITNKVVSFFDKMGQAYAICDLIVCRSGAITIAEITSLGIASILIPYPYGDAHQKQNADILKNQGAAFVIQEADLTKDNLSKIINNIFSDKAQLSLMRENSKKLARPDAAEKLTREVMSLIK